MYIFRFFVAVLLLLRLDNYTEKALRRIELSGNTEDDTMEFIKKIAEEYGIEPEIEVICEHIKAI